MGQLPETRVLEAFNGSSSPPGIQLLQLLIAIQAASLASLGGGPDFDPKYYVDLPLKYPVDTTAEAFSSLPRTLPSGTISSDTLQRFLEENFGIPGSDLVACRPQDYTTEPVDFLPGVCNPEARRWALKIHSLWLLLARRVADCVKEKPNQHTLLPLQHPVIVPGERFREVYYWDSYWIIRGLLVSKMLETAKGMVQNLLALAGKHGFVANGARTYYQNRSQPPLLSMMVCAIHLEAANLTLVEQALPILRKEYNFWTTEPHEVVIQDHQMNKHRLSRYYAQWNTPRPESCIIDEAIAKGLSKAHQAELYRDIATAAESGWDFSSRWMEDHQNLFSLRTSAIIPVDLNAFLLQMELDIAFLARATGDDTTERYFTMAANARRLAIQTILWNEDESQWFDYWLPVNNSKLQSVNSQRVVYDMDSGHLNLQIFASNFIPLWCGVILQEIMLFVCAGDAKIERVLEAFNNSGLMHPGGIATSLRETGQQWDFPNAWAPLQHMIIEGLATLNSEKANKMAIDISRRWLKSNYVAFEETGHMVEKYDARYCGKVGGGGEYNTQTGFGWTNGVALTLLHKYGWADDQPLAPTYNLTPWFTT
ncbi:unnamed protein product [Sphagnum troendelagicum]|uniref:Trehalase n=1 Tax=Sphagnum troendelagicum TaxID=128251 RepID=A0ABP0V0H5_9BRYO